MSGATIHALREAEPSMNVIALEPRRSVSGTSLLHEIGESRPSKDCLELTFRPPTRAI